MGALPSVPTVHVPPQVSSITTAFFEGVGSIDGTQIAHKRQVVFKAYLEVCSAMNGVVLLPATRKDTSAFQTECLNTAPSLYRFFQVKGQRRFVHNGIFYFVLIGSEVKMFVTHMHGLEAIVFLSIPSVVVPVTSIVHFMGISIACIEILHLKNLVKFDPKHGGYNKHGLAVKAMLTKALRLRENPPVVFYECGDGNLAVVDASSLLPQLCAPATNGKYWHTVRAELIIGRDCSCDQPVSGALFPPREPQQVDNMIEQSNISLVLDAANSKKKPNQTPVLNAINACLVPGTALLSDVLSTTGLPSPSIDQTGYEFRYIAGFRSNLSLTQFIYLIVVPSVAQVLETFAPQTSCREVIELIHVAGLGVYTLGALWHTMSSSSPIRSQIAVEMVARAAKRWLEVRLYRNSSQFEGFVMDVFRGITDPNFVDIELMPIVVHMFGKLDPAPKFSDIPFRMLFDRLQEQTGVSIQSGKLQTISPRIRTIRLNFTLSMSDEASICSVAARREDGMAATIVIVAAAKWARNVERHFHMVNALKQRVAHVDSAVTQMFLGCMEIDLFNMFLSVRQSQKACDLLDHSILRLYAICSEYGHDKLFLARNMLPFIDVLMKEGRKNSATVHVRQLLQLGAFNDPASLCMTSARSMLEELHRVSVETCFITRQLDEALIVSQRWFRMCPSLFGHNNAAMCRATKLYFNALLKAKRRGEALQMARSYGDLCLSVYGPDDLRTAGALSDLGSMLWKRDPSTGLSLFHRALDVYRRQGNITRAVCTSMYNIGLATARLNKLGTALYHFTTAKEVALKLQEMTTVAMCENSEKTVRNVAAMKVQRWYREIKYGYAKSQTTKTDVTTLCSTLSWSDDCDEIHSSTTNE